MFLIKDLKKFSDQKVFPPKNLKAPNVISLKVKKVWEPITFAPNNLKISNLIGWGLEKIGWLKLFTLKKS